VTAETKCMICGRLLTDPWSVKRGIGPVCYAAILKKRREKEAGDLMKCKVTGKPCDPESYFCHILDHTSKRIQNKICERLIPAEEAEVSG